MSDATTPSIAAPATPARPEPAAPGTLQANASAADASPADALPETAGSDAALDLNLRPSGHANGHTNGTHGANGANGRDVANGRSNGHAKTLIAEEPPTGTPNLPATEPAYGAPAGGELKSYTPKPNARRAKKGSVGLTFPRRFTSAGQDPFESVEWELRTAAITGEDGKVVFEQRDCEIPKTWSQLATNVVVSKYFRGPLGSPSRETSVRQIIGRVADTMHRWGVEGNYFATPQDAQAFRDELVYLLLHQYGSFNSPVWFNIGVKGAKQQGSACQPYHALVSTPSGLIPIGKLVEEDAVGRMVYDANGVARIVATKANGRKRVLRIHTKAGYTLDVTPDHLVWKATGWGQGEVCSRPTGKFVEAGTLRAGDQLLWCRTPVVDKAQEPCGEEAEAALAGWLQSDGFVGHYENGTNRSLTIEAMVVNQWEEDWVRSALSAVFPAVHSHTRAVQTQDESLQCRRIRLYGEVLRSFVEKWDLLKRRDEMQAPAQLFTAPLPVVAAYLRSLFQAEGYVIVRENALIGLDMISEKLVRGAQQLLLRFGIYSRVRFKSDCREDRHGCWSLSIRTLGDRERFASEIGFLSEDKIEKLQGSLQLKGLRLGDAKRLEVECIEERGEMPVYDIQTTSGEYLSGNIRVHNCFINSVYDDMESIMELAATEARLFKGGSGAGTNLWRIRSSKEQLSGGGIASGPVSFMRGWDSFAGAIKCLTPDAYVYTDRGLQTLGEVIAPGLPSGFHADESVVLATKDGPTRISHVYVSPQADTLRLKLRHTNLSLRGTAEHPVLTLTPEFRLHWKRLVDLAPGDRVAVSRRTELWPQAALSLEGFAPTLAWAKKTLAYPTHMTPQLARLLGYMIAEGCLDKERFRFCNADADVFADFLACVEAVFGIDPAANVRSRVHPKTGMTTWMFEACWTNAVRFLQHVGLTAEPSAAKRVPWSIRCSPRALVVEFLRAYFEGDGHVSSHVYAASASEHLLREIQLLLLNMGMVSLLRPHPVAGKPYWTLYLRGEQAFAFVREIGFISARKRAAAERVGDKNTNTNIDVVPFLAEALRARASRNKYFRCADGVVRSLGFGFFNRKPGCSISYGRLRRTLALVENVRAVEPQWAQTLEWMLERELFWDAVASVEPEEPAITYDFTVPGTHSFIANGIVNHNSGGTTRRAAKMVLLNADHPDIEEFIVCKAEEEKKAWALIDAGYNGGFNVPGGAYDSVDFQNANHSVRATDEFMRAAENNADWTTRAVTTGKPLGTHKARELLRQIAESTYICGDPGLQYDTTINDWHTSANTDRIHASNPCCVTGDTLVAVADGRNAVPIKELCGSEVPVYAHDHAAGRTTISRMWNIGVKRAGAPVYRVRLDDGSSFRATDDHLTLQRDGSYRMVRDLKPGDSLMPFHSKVLAPAKNRTRRRYYWKGASWQPQYRAVWEWFNGAPPAAHHIHHRDFDALNDRPDNLLLMPESEHNALHAEKMRGDNNPARRAMNDEWRRHIAEAVRGEKNPNYGRTHSPATRRVMRENAARRWSDAAQRATASTAAHRWMDEARAEGRSVGRRPGERHERCCPVCRANFVTPRDAQIFCSLDCRYSPMGMQMCGEKTWAKNRGRALSAEHRAKLSASVSRASDPQTKRRAMRQGQRNSVLKTARLLMDNDLAVTLESWDARREDARRLGVGRVPTAATAARHFESDAALNEQAALYNHKVVAVEFCGHEDVYDGTVDTHHNFAILTSEEPSCIAGALNFSGVFIHNSEFVFLDDTACNLASLNLMKFRSDNGEFDADAFVHACETFITAQEIIVSNASYPTEKIARNSEDYRPLGLGYANLGALLMAQGTAYDSDEGRALAGAITAVMTGAAYRQSARIASNIGPFNGYGKNREPMLRVIGKHRDAVSHIDHDLVPPDTMNAAQRVWDEALVLGQKHGFRNAQATVLAPTGCLVGDSLVLTSRGLVRLQSLGNVAGAKWQPLDVDVATDEGPRAATKFYVNGAEPVVTVETARGYRIQGTPAHRVKIIDDAGLWQWRRFADIKPGDRVPLMLGGLLGEPQTVPLPPLPEAYWTSDHTTFVPRHMTADLAEFVGYFMGDGSLHAKGIRLCVARADADVVERLRQLGRSLFGLEAALCERAGYTEVAFHSVRLTLWWEACGFAKTAPGEGHSGKGYAAHIPDAVLHANDPQIYAAFIRGLFEADGTVTGDYVSWTTVTERFSRDVQSLLLALGFVTTRKTEEPASGKWGVNANHVLRLLNVSTTGRFCDEVGFVSNRKRALCRVAAHPQAARHDHIPLSREMVDALAPENDELRRSLLLQLSRTGTVSRRAATELLKRARNDKLGRLLGFFYDAVKTAELGEEQFTYDLSVPDNVTYTANGFISHNTIAFMMDCDTTGIEPDIALVKYKKLVGGGLFKIVNQTVPEALQKIGYDSASADQIVEHIDKNDTIEGAPGLKEEHLPVFDCAFKAMNGTRSIHYMGHIRMMAAAQPFISGAISKTVNVPEAATVEEIMQAYTEAWKLGLKAVAIYRDNSKRTQPLSTSTDAMKAEAKDKADAPRAVRRKLPDERQAITHKFSIAGQEGYFTVGLYEDGSPGEIFIKMSKEGSTISGLMDSFAVAVSMSLQYGVPLRVLVNKFTHTRFEPSGYTTNKEIPIAKSLMDYIFRWFDLKFHPNGDNGSLHGKAHQPALLEAPQGTSAPTTPQSLSASGDGGDLNSHLAGMQTDAPPCPECGTIMTRAGACYKCSNCGTTSGCG